MIASENVESLKGWNDKEGEEMLINWMFWGIFHVVAMFLSMFCDVMQCCSMNY